MGIFSYNNKDYEVDSSGFLTDRTLWDEGFAEGMAAQMKIDGGLTDGHWKIIRFIRSEFEESGECPLVFSTCRASGISPKNLKSLFPTGYTKGACKLAGLSYRDRFMDYYGENLSRGKAKPTRPAIPMADSGKVYRVDAFGFLVDPSEWDEAFAVNKAREMKMPGGLSERHEEVIQYLRRSNVNQETVPSVSECCEALGMELDQIEKLFPDGYVRGALKIAGLRIV